MNNRIADCANVKNGRATCVFGRGLQLAALSAAGSCRKKIQWLFLVVLISVFAGSAAAEAETADTETLEIIEEIENNDTESTDEEIADEGTTDMEDSDLELTDSEASQKEMSEDSVFTESSVEEEQTGAVLSEEADTVNEEEDLLTANTDSVPMYRIYNPNSGEHFYTADKKERDYLFRQGWFMEGVGWVAPKKSSRPVYRLYNANAGDHHYTMSDGERKYLISHGWKYEGIGWYSADSKATPLYRQYNPNAAAGSHNYTTVKKEHNYLVSLGWKNEGIAWYAISGGYDETYKNPNASIINKYIAYGDALAKDDSHGYSQDRRWGPDYDCSSFVISCLRAAGIDTGDAVYTGNMKNELLKHGFVYMDLTSLSREQKAGILQFGDVLLAHNDRNQHAAFYVGNNWILDATDIEGDEATGDQSGREICRRESWLNYDGFLRYVGG
ncbi:MAG: NlpC/P60 family protein [Eubacteriales bacterium]|nr:NlpC/P60 family protein [Eubacteriales bacterium]